ncbi:Smr/MutS family protein [Psychroflexus lacisalsi]|jgi:dsDNA-specific endonuclease/ATPase MutS2|uniref:Smr domain-containing protein n=1 Tax=Psychroflexus lacisalsi TaxID=503928 RepID=A0ABN1K7M5_9FLAO|nr:Smr/MutS family protein [Psychroflexus lacisalsi]MBZ9619506.1 DNA mismatch repair protein MutS [Psychroflexus lacisalsi]
MKNKNFQIGDKVELIDDDVSGIVTKVESNEVVFETSDGFEMKVPFSLVVKIDGQLDVDLKDDILLQKLKSDLNPKRKGPSQKPKRQQPAMEVDLHIHNIVDKTSHLSNFEMLNIQLEHSRRKIEFAIEKRIKRIVFIHGVGQGVLKAELHTLFRRYDQVEFYDADYQKYGLGATEIYIYDQ